MKAIVYERYGPPDVLQLKETHRYVKKGHKKGNVVITVEREPRG